MEKLVLKKDGKLIETKWFYNHEKDEGSYIDSDVTDKALRRLFEHCELDKDVTLRDVFLLLNSELGIFDAIIGNWCEEIVKEGLHSSNSKDTEIDYLELYWHLENQKIDDDEGFQLLGMNRPDFHGMGKVLEEDHEHGFKKGDRIAYSTSFQSTSTLIDLPVKLKYETEVYEDDYTSKDLMHKSVIKFNSVPYTLLNILYGIIWELSFYGPPSERDLKGKEILDIVEDIKKNPHTGISTEEFLKELDKEE